MRSSSNRPGFWVEMEATPVAIALIAVGGIILVAYSPMAAENKRLAIMALGQLAGGATGVAIPRLSRGNAPPPPPPNQGRF